MQLRCYVFPWKGGGGAGGEDANSTLISAINVLGSNKTAGEGTATTPVLQQPNATSEVQFVSVTCEQCIYDQ